MKHKSTLKRGKRFRRHTRKKSVYGGMKSAPRQVRTLRADAPSFLRAAPPSFLRANAPAWAPVPVPVPVPEPEPEPEVSPSAVAIDCEMVLGPERKHVLAHIAIVDFDGNQLYNKYVIPIGGINSITDYLTPFSGITKNLLENKNSKALPFETVKSEVHAILQDKLIVGHGLINDFKVLDYTPDDDSVWDTTVINGYMKNHPTNIGLLEGSKRRRQAKKLKILAKEIANNNIQMPGKMGHSPLEDARASMNLYRISQGFPKIVYDDMAVA